MILSEADKAIYFPLVELTGFALTGAIRAAQNAAEVVTGRSLEMTQFQETIEVPLDRVMGLRYHPIDLNRPISVMADGQELSSLHWSIDQYGVLKISPFQPLSLRSITVSYWAGFNFSDNSEEVKSIKAALGSILSYQVLA